MDAPRRTFLRGRHQLRKGARFGIGEDRELVGAVERFSCRPPDAGAICYVRYHADVNSTRLAEYLRTEKSTLVVPGDQFGMDHYLRIGFGPERHELEAALARVQEAFDELTAS